MQLRSLASAHRDKVRFCLVYIAEAHAADEWPIGSTEYCLPQHAKLEDRIGAAQRTVGFLCDKQVQEFGLQDWEVVVDSLEDRFGSVYGAWPTRFYLVAEKRLRWIAQPEGATYFVAKLAQALDRL